MKIEITEIFSTYFYNLLDFQIASNPPVTMKAKKSSKSAANYKTSTPTKKCTFCGILVELKNLGRHNIEVHSMLRSQGRSSIDFQRFNPIPSFKSIGNVEYDTDISASSEADSDECNGENKVQK